VVATALRTSAANLTLQAKAFAEAAAAQAAGLTALAEMYEGAAPRREGGQDIVAPAAAAPSPDNQKVIEEAKKSAVALINKQGGRDGLNALLTKHAGSVVAIKDIPAEKLSAFVADLEAALKAPDVSADDL
jgi:hypothetical protein